MTVLPDYLSVAAEDVSRAVQLEIDDKLDESIECYRSAIGTLLSSVQQDRCLKRQASVKVILRNKETFLYVKFLNA